MSGVSQLNINVMQPPYNAKADGIADDTSAIQLAIDNVRRIGGGVVFLPKGNYKITSTLILGSTITLRGLKINASFIRTATNDFDCITIEGNARKVTIEELTLFSTSGIGINSGIKCNDVNGGAEHLYRNLQIEGFLYGTKVKEIWWFNTLENVRWNYCGTSFYSEGTGGQNINNLFIRCYSNQPTTLGVRLSAFKNTTFLNCNFGGHHTFTGRHLDMYSVNQSVKFIGCNFEHLKIASGGNSVQIWSSSTVTFDDCIWADNSAISIGYEIKLRDTCTVTLINCTQYLRGANMRQIELQNSSKLHNLSADFNDIVHTGGSNASTRVFNLVAPRIIQTSPLYLNGGSQEVLALQSLRQGRLVSAQIVYNEATTSNIGVQLVLKSADNSYVYFDILSEPSKSKWSSVVVGLNRTAITTSPILFLTPGGKQGTGAVSLVLEYTLD